MAQSINTELMLLWKQHRIRDLQTMEKIMVGDKGFEFLIQEMSMIIFRFHGKKLIM